MKLILIDFTQTLVQVTETHVDISNVEQPVDMFTVVLRLQETGTVKTKTGQNKSSLQVF